MRLVFRRVSAAFSRRQLRMSRDGPARKPIRAPAIPKQCETENVATALSVSSSAGSDANGTSGSMTSEPCVTSWISSSPCSSARRARAASSPAVWTVPNGFSGSTITIARVRGVIAAATTSGSRR